jgi:hypothetical protein
MPAATSDSVVSGTIRRAMIMRQPRRGRFGAR